MKGVTHVRTEIREIPIAGSDARKGVELLYPFPDMTKYTYVRNNPTNRVDPSGEIELPVPVRPSPPSFPPPAGPPVTKPNCKTWFGFIWCPCGPKKKKDRIKPIPGMGKPASTQIPVGPAGGNNTFYSPPFPRPVGAGGCDACIAVVAKCPSGIAVFHFKAGADEPCCSLGSNAGYGPTTNWSSCTAIVCGGDGSAESDCLADSVLACLKGAGLKIEGVSGASACGVNPDGSWYEWQSA